MVKRYVAETGSGWLKALVTPTAGNEIYIARITEVEVISALARRAKSGGMTAVDFRSAIAGLRSSVAGDFLAIEVNLPVVRRATDLAESYALRGYDAVQLAAALHANGRRLAYGGDPLVLVSADTELNAAAMAEGLVVDDPNAHP